MQLCHVVGSVLFLLCGCLARVATGIFGGQNTDIDEFVWATAIRRVNDGSFLCSGALIGARYVVTADYCIDSPTDTFVEVSYWCRSPTNCGRALDIIGVRELFRHIGKGGGSGGVMGLLELERETLLPIRPAVPYLGKSVHPEQPTLKNRKKATMVGGGRAGTSTDISFYVRELQVSGLSRKKCKKRVSDPSLVTEHDVCFAASGGSPCRGDAGAPVVVPGKGNLKGRDVILAIHSVGQRDCSDFREDFSSIAFRMEDAADLIQSVVCEGDHPEDWCERPPPSLCELSNNINGGFAIADGEYPWFTAIVRPPSQSFLCSGALVSDRYVLSAAHCADASRTWNAIVGYRCSAPDNCGHPEELIPISFDYRHAGGDFVIFELRYPVSRARMPSSFAIPNLDASYFDSFEKNDELVLVGGGETDEEASNYVQKIPVKLVKKKVCHRESINFVESVRGRTVEGYICSLPTCGDIASGSCRGDSGGALVRKGPNGEDVIVAIHAFGRRFCDADRTKPDGHYRVDAASEDLRQRICDGESPAEWCP